MKTILTLGLALLVTSCGLPEPKAKRQTDLSYRQTITAPVEGNNVFEGQSGRQVQGIETATNPYAYPPVGSCPVSLPNCYAP
jgi:hypothetical protein